MRKQIFETPRADVPYIGEFETKDKRIGYKCKRDCIVGGQKWVDFKKDHNKVVRTLPRIHEWACIGTLDRIPGTKRNTEIQQESKGKKKLGRNCNDI